MLCGLQDLSSRSEMEPMPSAAKAWSFEATVPPGNSLIPRIFTESLLHSRHYSRCWSSEEDRQKCLGRADIGGRWRVNKK